MSSNQEDRMHWAEHCPDVIRRHGITGDQIHRPLGQFNFLIRSPRWGCIFVSFLLFSVRVREFTFLDCFFRSIRV